MRKEILESFLTLCVLSISGCSIGLVNSNSEKELQGVKRLDLKEGPVYVKWANDGSENGSIDYRSSGIRLNQPCRVKYHKGYYNFLNLIVVEGKLPNGKKYNTWLDTGYGGYVLTNGLTVAENRLAVYPVGKVKGDNFDIGICHLPTVKMGQADIINPPCIYAHRQWEVRLAGLPIWRQRGVLMGLGVLRKFSYLAFDNPHKEVEFCYDKTFMPVLEEQWDAYQFKIENDKIVANMPIGGIEERVVFDTCGGYGFVIRQDMWEKISNRIKVDSVRKSEFWTGFFGKKQCRKARVKDFEIANVTIKEDDVIILVDANSYVDNAISMKYFRDTIVVLDFERNLVWIKRNIEKNV